MSIGTAYILVRNSRFIRYIQKRKDRKMKYKENWEETKQKWEKYWKRENTGRPLMSIIAEKPEAMDAEKAAHLKSVDVEDKYMNYKNF